MSSSQGRILAEFTQNRGRHDDHHTRNAPWFRDTHLRCNARLDGLLTASGLDLCPLPVCRRSIWYQSDLPLTSRGFSVASGMSRKCPPELVSGTDRVLDKQTSTRDSSSHTWGAWMSNEGQAPHPSERPSTPPTRSYALYRGCVTVRRASPKLVAKRGRQLRKDMNSTTITFLNWGR